MQANLNVCKLRSKLIKKWIESLIIYSNDAQIYACGWIDWVKEKKECSFLWNMNEIKDVVKLDLPITLMYSTYIFDQK